MHIRGILLALVGFLCICPPLFAVEEISFSVGIVALQDESSAALDLIGQAGTAYAKEYVLDDAYKTYLANRSRSASERTVQNAISLAYAAKSEAGLEKAREMEPDHVGIISDRISVRYDQIPYEKGYGALLTSYPEARPWFASNMNLDALILLNRTRLASHDRIRLYWYDLFSDTTTLIFDQVVMEKDLMEMSEQIGLALLSKTAGPEYGLLVLDDLDSSVSVLLDGEALPLNDRRALLFQGQYTLSLGGDLYVPKQIPATVLPNTITHIPSSLERKAGQDMLLTSFVGKVNWYVDGGFIEAGCDLSLSTSMVPLVIVAQKQGFSSKTLQVEKPVRKIGVSLQPEWMSRASLQQEEQGDFYASFRNTLLYFGLYVASITLSQTFDTANPLWQPLQIATSGFALVSTMHTIMNFASYVALAGSGVR